MYITKFCNRCFIHKKSFSNFFFLYERDRPIVRHNTCFTFMSEVIKKSMRIFTTDKMCQGLQHFYDKQKSRSNNLQMWWNVRKNRYSHKWLWSKFSRSLQKNTKRWKSKNVMRSMKIKWSLFSLCVTLFPCQSSSWAERIMNRFISFLTEQHLLLWGNVETTRLLGCFARTKS